MPSAEFVASLHVVVALLVLLLLLLLLVLVQGAANAPG
jgi:hypothetical protein